MKVRKGDGRGIELVMVPGEPAAWDRYTVLQRRENTPDAQAGLINRHKTLTSKYDGSIPFENYKKQFEIVARLNRWTALEKALQLQACLQGGALSAISGMDCDQTTDYETVAEALMSRYGTGQQKELHSALLRSRARKKDESLPDLAHDLLRLARYGHPEAPRETQEHLAMEQFFEAIPDRELRVKLQLENFRNIHEALQAAIRLEIGNNGSKIGWPNPTTRKW